MSDLVFICHAGENADIANLICERLEKSAAIQCWIAPRDTEAGNFMGSLVKAIKRCTIVVLVFSDYANRSPYVMRELQKAVDLGIPIIPFRISDVKPSEEMDFAISSQHWIDGLLGDMEKNIEVLISKVKEKLKLSNIEVPHKSIEYVGIHITDEAFKIVNIMNNGSVKCDNKLFRLYKSTSEKELQNEVINIIDDIACDADDIAQVADVNQIESISITVPGPTKEEEGKVHLIPRARGEQGPPMGMKLVLKKKLKYDGKISLFNDANAAARAEYHLRNAEIDSKFWARSLVYIYWSGGIGSGVVINDKLISGNNGYAGEIGHTKISDYGPLCSCGGSGCIESYLSEGALKKLICRTYEKFEQLHQRFKIDHDYPAPKLPPLMSHKGSPKDADNINVEGFLSEARITNDASLAWQNEVLDRIIRIYAIAISNLVYHLDPEIVVFGGNLGRCINEETIELIKLGVQKKTFIRGFKIEKTRYNEYATAFGGYLNLNRIDENDRLRENIFEHVML